MPAGDSPHVWFGPLVVMVVLQVQVFLPAVQKAPVVHMSGSAAQLAPSTIAVIRGTSKYRLRSMEHVKLFAGVRVKHIGISEACQNTLWNERSASKHSLGSAENVRRR